MLGAAKLRSQLIQNQISKKAKPVFHEMQDMLSDSIIQSRQIMAEMSPHVLNEQGLIPALEWLTEQIKSKNNIEAAFTAKNCREILRHDLQVLVFQATRELLMNAVKHAGAREAAVSVSGDRRNIRIEVSDDGKGFGRKVSFRAESAGGYGLFSIRERLGHLGGKLTIRSTPGKGTSVKITAPKILQPAI